jgi:hypothetical protein
VPRGSWRAEAIAAAGARGHLHTTLPDAHYRGLRRAIVLEATDGRYGYFDDQPIENRARPLAILLPAPQRAGRPR